MKVKTIDMTGFGKYSGYEFVCQLALWAGVDYLAKMDQPDKILDKTVEFKNIVGIAETPESAAELEQIWSKMDKELFMGWTGAQHQAVVGHLRFIGKNGIKKWHDEFKDQPGRIYELDLDEARKALKKEYEVKQN